LLFLALRTKYGVLRLRLEDDSEEQTTTTAKNKQERSASIAILLYDLGSP